MAKFVDRFGHEWTLDFSVHEIKRIRKALEINLFDAFAADYAVYAAVVGDVEKLVAVAFVACAEEVNARGVTEEAFGKAMAGDALRSLGDAFTEALIDFFPNARARETVRATLTKGRELLEMRQNLMAQAVAALDVSSLAGTPSAGSTSSPESPASIPAP